MLSAFLKYIELPTVNHNDLPRGSEQFPTSPIQEVPSQERNQASSVSLHCITTWSWFPCTHVLYGTSIGGQPIAIKKENIRYVEIQRIRRKVHSSVPGWRKSIGF